MRQKSILCLLALLSCSPCTLRAQTGVMGGYVQGLGLPPQTSSAPTITGTVTGTVLLGDTQHPARFALVTLERIPSESNDSLRGGTGFAGGSIISNNGTRTGFDGTFTIAVAPGDYYVTVIMPGYISEYSLLQTAFSAGATAADLAAQVPTVHVTAEGNSSVVVTLQHGAALSGRIQWEDGSPVVTMAVMATPVAAQQPLPSPLNGIRAFMNIQSQTDDRGAFRINSLASGDYFVEAVVYPGALGPSLAGSSLSPIRIYAPGVFRKKDAKPIALHPGDDLDDLRMVIDLRSLHTVSGHVSSTNASRNIVSGRATLVDSVETSLQPGAMIDAKGDFSIPFVPSGTYRLTIQGSTQPSRSGYPVRSRNSSGTSEGIFAPSTQTLVVGDTDVTGLAINLTPAQ